MKEPFFYQYIAKPLIYIYVKLFLRPKIIGIENIPPKGPVILVGNHRNNLDSVMISAINKRVVHFLAKDSLLKGWRKYIFCGMAIIPVNRNIHDKSAITEAIKVLDDNKVVGIFPEGTTNKTTEPLLPFKIGAVKIASLTKVDIIPFVITGSYKIFNNDLCIEFLKPQKVPVAENLTKYNDILMNTISKKISEKRK